MSDPLRDIVSRNRTETLSGDHIKRLINAQIQLALDPYFFEEAS